MNAFPCLTTKNFLAYIADNAPLGIHRRGYNGVASLIPRQTGNNLFVPTYAGMNYETLWLEGLRPYQEATGSKFEPRTEPMRIERAGKTEVVLLQPETSHARVSGRITFRVEEPCYLHQRIELTLHRRFCGKGERNRFSSLWASYMHMPPDHHVYLKAGGDPDDLAGWVGLTKADHGATEYQVRGLPDDREIDAREHLETMASEPPMYENEIADSGWAPDALPRDTGGPLSFYYGLCHGDQLFLMMFRQPDRFRLAYSPCGGGREPYWSPAWDYVLHLDDAQIGEAYRWDCCLVVKPFAGRADVLREVRRYAEGAPAKTARRAVPRRKV
jgi:hypothetical protein